MLSLRSVGLDVFALRDRPVMVDFEPRCPRRFVLVGKLLPIECFHDVFVRPLGCVVGV